MTFWQKVSLVAFSVLFVFAVVFSYLINAQIIDRPLKPWHMQPAVDADTLSAEYMSGYKLLDKKSVLRRFADSNRTTVAVLVDGWGVPFDTSLLRGDFAVFGDLPHKDYLHARLANRTRHAELSELRVRFDSTAQRNGVYLFGGDSLEYGRNLYVDSLGYERHVFCQRCGDSAVFALLDSLLSDSLVLGSDSLARGSDSLAQGDSLTRTRDSLNQGRVGVLSATTWDSRDGDRQKLRATLSQVAALARKHPEVRFVLVGSHRPNFGDPKIRRESFAHWVPVTVLN
ncbi:MAG: hypothetical protein IKJ76_08220 [Fibrobacter sp.]|nr:hypothetical protein [Fibrobacter sp.]